MHTSTRSLSRILAQIPEGMLLSRGQDVGISGIAIDSRRVAPGDLFVAMRGRAADGHAFIDQALANGAVAVAGELPPPMPATVPYFQLRNPRQALSWIAAAYHGWPGRNLRVIGVTGTDGKTTTCTLIHHILTAAGKRAGLVSTVNAVIDNREVDTGFHVTTPDAHDVQRYLAAMVGAGLTHVVLETTSHGWAQHRVEACEFDVAVITNITHEHLDEHGSYEAYRDAKARLLLSLALTSPKPGGNPRLAVLNRDDQSFEYLAHVTPTSQISYGLDELADLRASEVRLGARGSTFTAEADRLRIAISTELPGIFNVSNCLAAIGAAFYGCDVSEEAIREGIASSQSVPGRLERIEMGQSFAAIVDFAHTPNALRVTLEAARGLVAADMPGRRVIAVFGSAGLRDRAKRRMMAEISAELADLTILTAEDPRTESLEAILSEMADSARTNGGVEGESFWRIPDRGEAIRFAVQSAQAGDVVLACGKGHEQSMCFGIVEHPWDDRTAMRAALADLLKVPGPEMPYLPTRDQQEADWLH